MSKCNSPPHQKVSFHGKLQPTAEYMKNFQMHYALAIQSQQINGQPLLLTV